MQYITSSLVDTLCFILNFYKPLVYGPQVIELKRDAIAAVVQNNLFKKTSLQTTFSCNMLALVDSGKQPQRISLREALKIFLEFRFETVRRRTAYQLKKLEDRDHIVQGLLVALSNVDRIIAGIMTYNLV